MSEANASVEPGGSRN